MDTRGGILRRVVIMFSFLLFVVAGIGVLGYRKFLTAPIFSGQVRVESGTVAVNGAHIIGSVALAQGDTIETANGLATVFLHESVIIALAPNTKIVVTDLNKKQPRVTQLSGKTWNEFTALSGVQGYTITEHGHTATVHGTAFELSEGKMMTGEGTVAYDANGKSFNVLSGQVAEVVNDAVVTRQASPDEQTRIQDNIRASIAELRYLRDQEMTKYPIIVEQIKNQFHVTDAQIQSGFLSADMGQIDIDALAAKIPFHIAAADRIVEITKAIQQLQHAVK